MKRYSEAGPRTKGSHDFATSLRLTKEEMELLQLVQNKLGLSRAEALRTCLRSYVYVLREVMK